MTVDRDRLASLTARELDRFASAHPRSRGLHERARDSLISGVPMPWMVKWAGGFPVYVDVAEGAHLSCVDGHDYVDFSLGDTGAMSGHGPAPTLDAIRDQLYAGLTHMLPTEDAAIVAAELGRRFGVPAWQFSLTATDANRFALRLARALTGRPRILVFDYCYHGSVDETFAVLDASGAVVARRGLIGAPVAPSETTKVVEFNDVPGLEAALAPGDVAVVLAEPAMTNIGIVLPDPGFHDALREATRRTGTLLLIDETHTLCAGPGGYTGAHGLEPDMVVVGKTIGGGIPIGAYGVSRELADRIASLIEVEDSDIGGIGGTLAGNALSLAAVRATLEGVLTEDAFGRMIPLAERWQAGVEEVLARRSVPWHVTRLGCRAEYHFLPRAPRNGAEAAAAADYPLERYLHLAALNRGIVMTPFHNMALMSPATSEADVDRHTAMFDEVVAELFAG
ncbi:MAG TPA: aspartate aminotransferase family protein [Candidatus Limnocylindrales bacterium]|nr:aspartate aminotransferase family protein [Candidatus Limnocylindrales bacterium]